MPAYALLSITGILAALFLSLRTARLRALHPDTLWNAGVFAIASAFLLSRALSFLLLLSITHGHPGLSFREILRLSSISYLSLLLTAALVLAWLRAKHLPLLPTLDAWAPCAALLWAFLSLADAAAHTADGLPTHLPWAIRNPAGLRVHPVALYTAALALALSVTLLNLLRRIPTPGRVTALALLAAGLIVFLLNMLRLPDQPAAQTLLDSSQWLALLAIVIAGFLFAATSPTETRPCPQKTCSPKASAATPSAPTTASSAPSSTKPETAKPPASTPKPSAPHPPPNTTT